MAVEYVIALVCSNERLAIELAWHDMQRGNCSKSLQPHAPHNEGHSVCHNLYTLSCIALMHQHPCMRNTCKKNMQDLGMSFICVPDARFLGSQPAGFLCACMHWLLLQGSQAQQHGGAPEENQHTVFAAH